MWLVLQAIIESDPFSITLKDMTKARKLGEDFVKAIGCKDIECLYAKVHLCVASTNVYFQNAS